jgi:uncharacterized protein YbjT (DUF2867 family)
MQSTNGGTMTEARSTLVLGATGRTGRRVLERLTARGVPVRAGSRSGTPPFDWEDRSTWAPVLEGMEAVYISYYPDVAVPGARETVSAFVELAVGSGATRLVLLAGRGEPEADLTEQAVRDSGADWTILRPTWFNQNFSENLFVDEILGGELATPAGDVKEPFVDMEDIADVAAAPDVRRGGQGDRRRCGPGDPLRAGVDRRAHVDAHRVRSAVRVRLATQVPLHRGA